jgi:DNA-binding response OmpR family regulator
MRQILVIEDEDDLRNVMTTALTQAGYGVMAAPNGRVGLEQFRAEPCDLVITDILMPERDGIEVVLALRKEFPTVPVIAISGNSSYSPVYLHTVDKLGAHKVLAKPFGIPVLLAAVEAALSPDKKLV